MLNVSKTAVPCMEEVDQNFLSSTWEGFCKEVENVLHIRPLLPRPLAPPHIWGLRTQMES